MWVCIWSFDVCSPEHYSSFLCLVGPLKCVYLLMLSRESKAMMVEKKNTVFYIEIIAP
jgi:hypothetical protein